MVKLGYEEYVRFQEMNNRLLVLIVLWILLGCSLDESEPGGGDKKRSEDYKVPQGLIDLGKGSYEYRGKRYPREVRTEKAGIEMIMIEPGEFLMGISESLVEAEDKYGFQQRVKINKLFYLGKGEVSQGQYKEIMRENPSHFEGRNNPVESVSWNDAKEFCRRMGSGFRLPTEAEWEYACRAGTQTAYYWGDKIDGDYCWWRKNSEMKTHPVGEKRPNAWGLCDMIGNVREWCEDWYSRHRAKHGIDPQVPSKDKKGNKACRGATWYNYRPKNLLSGKRCSHHPTYEDYRVGFRVARPLE